MFAFQEEREKSILNYFFFHFIQNRQLTSGLQTSAFRMVVFSQGWYFTCGNMCVFQCWIHCFFPFYRRNGCIFVDHLPFHFSYNWKCNYLQQWSVHERERVHFFCYSGSDINDKAIFFNMSINVTTANARCPNCGLREQLKRSNKKWIAHAKVGKKRRTTTNYGILWVPI